MSLYFVFNGLMHAVECIFTFRNVEVAAFRYCVFQPGLAFYPDKMAVDQVSEHNFKQANYSKQFLGKTDIGLIKGQANSSSPLQAALCFAIRGVESRIVY